MPHPELIDAPPPGLPLHARSLKALLAQVWPPTLRTFPDLLDDHLQARLRHCGIRDTRTLFQILMRHRGRVLAELNSLYPPPPAEAPHLVQPPKGVFAAEEHDPRSHTSLTLAALAAASGRLPFLDYEARFAALTEQARALDWLTQPPDFAALHAEYQWLLPRLEAYRRLLVDEFHRWFDAFKVDLLDARAHFVARLRPWPVLRRWLAAQSPVPASLHAVPDLILLRLRLPYRVQAAVVRDRLMHDFGLKEIGEYERPATAETSSALLADYHYAPRREWLEMHGFGDFEDFAVKVQLRVPPVRVPPLTLAAPAPGQPLTAERAFPILQAHWSDLGPDAEASWSKFASSARGFFKLPDSRALFDLLSPHRADLLREAAYAADWERLHPPRPPRPDLPAPLAPIVRTPSDRLFFSLVEMHSHTRGINGAFRLRYFGAASRQPRRVRPRERGARAYEYELRGETPPAPPVPLPPAPPLNLDALRAAYEQLVPSLELFRRQFVNEIENFLTSLTPATSTWELFRLTSRVRSWDSIRHYLTRLGPECAALAFVPGLIIVRARLSFPLQLGSLYHGLEASLQVRAVRNHRHPPDGERSSRVAGDYYFSLRPERAERGELERVLTFPGLLLKVQARLPAWRVTPPSVPPPEPGEPLTPDTIGPLLAGLWPIGSEDPMPKHAELLASLEHFRIRDTWELYQIVRRQRADVLAERAYQETHYPTPVSCLGHPDPWPPEGGLPTTHVTLTESALFREFGSAWFLRRVGAKSVPPTS